jgi:RNA-dependent RNA polymerase
MATPEKLINPQARVDSPVTPVKQISALDLNGHSINETYITRPGAIPNPPAANSPKTSSTRAVTRGSPQHGGNHLRYNSASQRNPQRPILKDGGHNWAHRQEGKIRLSGIPKSYWTKEVYHAMSLYGSVFRIEMIPGTRDNTAYVVFR